MLRNLSSNSPFGKKFFDIPKRSKVIFAVMALVPKKPRRACHSHALERESQCNGQSEIVFASATGARESELPCGGIICGYSDMDILGFKLHSIKADLRDVVLYPTQAIDESHLSSGKDMLKSWLAMQYLYDLWQAKQHTRLDEVQHIEFAAA